VKHIAEWPIQGLTDHNPVPKKEAEKLVTRAINTLETAITSGTYPHDFYHLMEIMSPLLGCYVNDSDLWTELYNRRKSSILPIIKKHGYSEVPFNKNLADHYEQRWHAFQFLKQIAANDFDGLVESHRATFAVGKPEYFVHAKRARMANKSRKEFPCAERTKYEIGTGKEPWEDNMIRWSNEFKRDEEHVRIHTMIKNPHILDVQEYACNAFGITFK
jgi:hypothetical protein